MISKNLALSIAAVKDVFQLVIDGFKDFGKLTLRKISNVGKAIANFPKKISQIFVKPKKPVAKPEIKEEFVKKEELEKLERELRELREVGLPVKEIVKEVEVSKVTKVEPIKEITKEIIKIDDRALAEIRAQIASWQTDIENLRNITKKLPAQPTYINVPAAPIMVVNFQKMDHWEMAKFQCLKQRVRVW